MFDLAIDKTHDESRQGQPYTPLRKIRLSITGNFI